MGGRKRTGAESKEKTGLGDGQGKDHRGTPKTVLTVTRDKERGANKDVGQGFVL